MFTPLLHRLCLCTVLLLPGTGMSADGAPEASDMEELHDWSGLYFGTAGTAQEGAGGAGLYAGYRHGVGRSVFGAELDAGRILRDGESVLRLKAMAGAQRGLGLYYGTAGIALAENGPDNSGSFFVGLGVDVRVTDTLSIGGEILYDDVDSGRLPRDGPVAASARVTFSF